MPPRKTHLDALDYQILQILKQDARAAASDIARQTGANERTVRKRIERLVSDGVARLTTVLEPAAFGYVTAADIFIEVQPAHEAQVLEALMAMHSVSYLAYGEDGNKISIEARFKDNDALRTFLRHDLANLPGVTITGYTYVPRILRNIDEWMPPPEDFDLS
jgi:DNA-binding Lrp family transcriptional regulator